MRVAQFDEAGNISKLMVNQVWKKETWHWKKIQEIHSTKGFLHEAPPRFPTMAIPFFRFGIHL